MVELEGLLVIHCHRQLAPTDLDAFRGQVCELADRRPAGVSALVVAHACSVRLVDEHWRSASVELAVELESLLRMRAIVLRGDPREAEGASAAIATVHTLAGSRTPTETFQDLPAALSWLALTDASVTLSDILFARALVASTP